MKSRALWAGIWLLTGVMACGGKAVDEPVGGGNTGGAGGRGGSGSGARAGNAGSGAGSNGLAREQAKADIEEICGAIEFGCGIPADGDCREGGLDFFDEAGLECQDVALSYFDCLATEVRSLPGCPGVDLEFLCEQEAETLDSCSGNRGDCVGGGGGTPDGEEWCDIDCDGIAASCATDPSGLMICRCENTPTSFSIDSCADLADFVEEACG